MVHFFRAEVTRANVWRQRLDTTTNWAVLTTAAAISFAFTQVGSFHVVIPLNMMMVTLFLWIEARRYRYFELWSYRVRLMETDFFAAMLVPPFHPAPDWAEALADHLLHPTFPISTLEALGRRLRRNYLWIYAVIGIAWMAKLWLFPSQSLGMDEFIARASIGEFPGKWVLLLALLFYLALILISISTLGLHDAAGEVLPRYPSPGEIFSGWNATDGGKNSVRAWFRPVRRRQQLLVYIITDHAPEVTERVIKEMNRGITTLTGTGGYTGKSHAVLMCALTTTEVPQLKNLVCSIDPSAFVILSPAQEIFGRGFMPLKEEK
jgi:uncharacterized membrane protein